LETYKNHGNHFIFVKKTHNRKSSGSDKIPYCWLKAFPATHNCNTKIFNTVINESKQMPDRVTTGVKYLLPKSEHLTISKGSWQGCT